MPYILWSKHVGGWQPELFDTVSQMNSQASRYEELGIECKETQGMPKHRDNFNHSARMPGKLGE